MCDSFASSILWAGDLHKDGGESFVVDITDLLRREPARIRDEMVGETITGKRVLVTGAGGSIGSELCRQISALQPHLLILFDRYENGLYTVGKREQFVYNKVC